MTTTESITASTMPSFTGSYDEVERAQDNWRAQQRLLTSKTEAIEEQERRMADMQERLDGFNLVEARRNAEVRGLEARNEDLTRVTRDREATAERLQQELNRLREDQRSQLVIVREQLGAKEIEMNAFKRQVSAVATRYGHEHNLCSVLDEALDELGLEQTRNATYTATAVIRVTFEATLRKGCDSTPDNRWVQSSLRDDEIREAIRDNFALDDDNDDVSVEDITIVIEDSELVEDD